MGSRARHRKSLLRLRSQHADRAKTSKHCTVCGAPRGSLGDSALGSHVLTGPCSSVVQMHQIGAPPRDSPCPDRARSFARGSVAHHGQNQRRDSAPDRRNAIMVDVDIPNLAGLKTAVGLPGGAVRGGHRLSRLPRYARVSYYSADGPPHRPGPSYRAQRSAGLDASPLHPRHRSRLHNQRRTPSSRPKAFAFSNPCSCAIILAFDPKGCGSEAQRQESKRECVRSRRLPPRC